MLKDPNCAYITKRSKMLQKVKTFHDDEAEITGYYDGKGRLTGVIGGFHCINKAGATFKCGSGLNDELRMNPPKIGSFITYKYQNLTKSGKPRFPTFLRVFKGRH